MSKENNAAKDIVIPVAVLAVICLVISGLLAVTNLFTKDVIKANEYAATLNSFVAVTGAADTSELTLHDDNLAAGVLSWASAKNGAIGIQAEAVGFDGGKLLVVVGFDANGAILGVKVDASTQTAGIGTKVADESVTDKQVGQTYTGAQDFTVAADGVTGATYSSKAYFEALNACISFYQEVK